MKFKNYQKKVNNQIRNSKNLSKYALPKIYDWNLWFEIKN
jgi:hypothetical protein